MAPGKMRSSACEAMVAASGRRQSWGSTSHSATSSPSPARISWVSMSTTPPGGRTQKGTVPVASAISAWAVSTSDVMTSSLAVFRRTWLAVWFWTEWPASAMARVRSGKRSTDCPSTKKVARAP